MSGYSEDTRNNGSEDLKALDKLAQSFFTSVLNKIEKQMKARRKRRKAYEAEIYQKWKKSIDLLEGLIDFCLYVGEKKNKELTRKSVFNNKHAALVKLHARLLLISNEIVSQRGIRRWGTCTMEKPLRTRSHSRLLERARRMGI
jgi:hypothetical protein